MSDQNVLLCVVDCLRTDHVTSSRMPFLTQWGEDHMWFRNHWATSHCTDPCMTHMLSGKHPDELKLYSMFYEHKEYSISPDVVMLAQVAREAGYDTLMIGNDSRWYKRGVGFYVDSRGWHDSRAVDACMSLLKDEPGPWFMVLHLVGMHTSYMGGSYANAAEITDHLLMKLVANCPDAFILVTADHGEGLGEKGIVQHGYGLWDFLTHIPLIVSSPCGKRAWIGELSDHGSTYEMMRGIIANGRIIFRPKEYVFQVGDTPPNLRHRGVVLPDGRQFIVEVRGQERKRFYVPEGAWPDGDVDGIEQALADHCALYGIGYWQEAMDATVLKRLRALGYFK